MSSLLFFNQTVLQQYFLQPFIPNNYYKKTIHRKPVNCLVFYITRKPLGTIPSLNHKG